MYVSIVIPCYRSGRSLPELIPQLVENLNTIERDYEIILVNDASPDNTWEVIEAISKEYSQVLGIDLLSNRGQFRATMCGMDYAVGEIVVTMDDDLQHPPSAVLQLIAELEEWPQVDCVFGAYRVKKHGRARNLGTAVKEHMFRILYGKPQEIQATSFRAMRRELATALSMQATRNPHLNALIFRSTRNLANVTVEHHERLTDRSGYSFLQLLSILIENVFRGSTVPLRMVSFSGFFSAASSCILASYYLLRYAMGAVTVPGFETEVLLIIFFGGMTLLAIGLIGEYILRILDEVSGAPRYVVRRSTIGRNKENATHLPEGSQSLVTCLPAKFQAATNPHATTNHG